MKAFALLGLVLLGACKDPKVAEDAVDAGKPMVVTSTPPPAACASDTDCRTLSSYCQEAPCACQALAKGANEPKCSSTVSCVVDPCARKTAACQNGTCVVVPKG